MLVQRYYEALQNHIAAIAADTAGIEQAARWCADSLAAGGAVHIFDSGHLVSHELINRAGGYVAFNRLAFSLQIDHPVKARSAAAPQPDFSYAYIQNVFADGQLRAGDVLFVGSVSGKTPNVIELALRARERGLKVIALTAIAYSSKLESEHPCGKRLFEVADLALDNHAPYGDAMLEVEGLDYPVCPASGIGATAVLWGVVASLTEEMLSRGLKPTVFPSVNRPDGRSLVAAVEAEALRKGY
jgi:uncharacterized phosphosugar-binding protein